MQEWTVRVVAQEAFMGNPNNPLIWHFLYTAPTSDAAIATIKRAVPFDAKITAIPGPMV